MSNKVLFLTPGLGKGGAEKQLFLLANHLVSKGFTVKIVSLLDRNMYEEELKQSDISYESLFFEHANVVQRILRYRRLVNKYSPDIIISFMFSANLLSRLTKLFHKCIVISSIRNEVFGGKLSEKLLKYTNFLDEAAVVNSETVRQKLLSADILDKRKAITIPNIVNVSLANSNEQSKALKVDIRNQLAISEGTFVFLFVANYRPQKDYDNLFNAIAVLKEHNFVVVMTGNLYDQSWPADRITELGIDDKVHLLGKRDDMNNFYSASDALVMSSKWEGMPNVILEAMSHELPVVSTNVGGVRDLIENGVNGILCEPRNHIKLAEAMKAIINLPESKLKTMGSLSKKIVEDNFNHNVIMEKWEKLLSGSMKIKPTNVNAD